MRLVPKISCYHSNGPLPWPLPSLQAGFSMAALGLQARSPPSLIAAPQAQLAMRVRQRKGQSDWHRRLAPSCSLHRKQTWDARPGTHDLGRARPCRMGDAGFAAGTGEGLGWASPGAIRAARTAVAAGGVALEWRGREAAPRPASNRIPAPAPAGPEPRTRKLHVHEAEWPPLHQYPVQSTFLFKRRQMSSALLAQLAINTRTAKAPVARWSEAELCLRLVPCK